MLKREFLQKTVQSRSINTEIAAIPGKNSKGPLMHRIKAYLIFLENRRIIKRKNGQVFFLPVFPERTISMTTAISARLQPTV